MPLNKAPLGRCPRTTLAALIEANQAALPADWQTQLGDTLGTVLAAIKQSAMNSDLQDPEVVAALTAAFTQLVEASLIEKKLSKAATVTPLRTGTGG
jgi:hypothetical protein